MDDGSVVATLDLYEHAPCGLLSTIANGTIQRINATLCSWLNVSANDLVGRKRFQDLLSVGSKIFHQTHWMPLLQVQGSVAEVQLELIHSDSSVLPVLVNAVQRQSQGALFHDLAIFLATDRKSYERELLKARRRAEELLESERKAQSSLAELLREREREAQERAVLAEQLVGIVSHDLRTPLSAILIGAHLLDAPGVTPTQARTLRRIEPIGSSPTCSISHKRGLAVACASSAASSTSMAPWRIASKSSSLPGRVG